MTSSEITTDSNVVARVKDIDCKVTALNGNNAQVQYDIDFSVFVVKNVEVEYLNGTTDDICNGAIELALVKQYVEPGDVVVLTAGIPSSNILQERTSSSNMMRIATVE